MKSFNFKLKALVAGIAAMLSGSGLAVGANLYTQKTYDASLALKAAALVAATANGTLILDLGNGLMDGDVIVDATAIEVDTTDESYEIIVQGSPDATFGTAANIVALGSVVLGHPSSVRLVSQGQGSAVTDLPGRYCLPIRNEKNGVTYRYLRLRTVVVGTIATGINYSAFLAKKP